MHETYIRVRGIWVHLYRAVDKFGKTLDFMLSKRCNKPAAIKFLARAMEANGLPRKIVMDKSAANTEGIREIKRMLKRFGCPVPIELMRIKYLNNLVEQDHRFIKRPVRPMLGFKSFASAASTISGIETVNMIRKGQFRPSCVRSSSSASWLPKSKSAAGRLYPVRRFATERASGPDGIQGCKYRSHGKHGQTDRASISSPPIMERENHAA